MLISLRLIIVIVSFLCAVNCLGQTKRALLIGIDTYESADKPHASIKFKDTDGPSRWDKQKWDNLEGAVNDVNDMRNLLTSPKFGFGNAEPYMRVLPEKEATRERILAEMQKYLVDLPKQGDIVVFYYAGHGSLRVNSLSKKGLNQTGSPLDNTIVAADANTGGFDVRDREIARIFNAALDKGVILTAIFDSCHSGTVARGVPFGRPTRKRFLPYDPRDINEGPDMKNGKEITAPADRTDNAALILSASQSNQLANESLSGSDAHGAFTTALIEALKSLPADTAAKDVFNRVSIVLRGDGIVDQDPQLDGNEARRRQPLFGKGSAAGKLRVVSEGIDDSGIVLNSGYADNVGAGSEFVRVTTDKKQAPVRIKVDRVDGLTRSHAHLLSPANAKIESGDLFELEKWIPEDRASLPIWVPPSNLSREQINQVVTKLASLTRDAKLNWIDDPALEAPTDIISWNGTEWLLGRSGTNEVQSLGATLEPDAIAAKLAGRDVRLFLNLPPSSELVKQLGLDRAEVPVKLLNRPESALYTLVGALDGQQVRYAWFRKSALETAQTITIEGNKIAGCPADSPYPVRSGWVSVANEKSAGQNLVELVTEIDKGYAWLNLPSPPADESSSGFPYHLALRRKSDKAFLENATALADDEFELLLESDAPVLSEVNRDTSEVKFFTRTGDSTPSIITPRWVYILTVDCTGEGQLLYPFNGIENKYPREGIGDFSHIVLPVKDSEGNNIKLLIGPPFGTDTYVLLTTNEPLPDPLALNFKGAGARKGPSSPLQNLLQSGSRKSRGVMPTEWGVQYIRLTSQPKK